MHHSLPSTCKPPALLPLIAVVVALCMPSVLAGTFRQSLLGPDQISNELQQCLERLLSAAFFLDGADKLYDT